MPIIKYQDDKYFKLMMLSLLIHDFIHDYGALGGLNRIKTLEEISYTVFSGKLTGSGPTKRKMDSQNQQIAKKQRTESSVEEYEPIVDDSFFNLDESIFQDISEYEFSPEIMSFLKEHVSDFNPDTFSIDIGQPITRSITTEAIDKFNTTLNSLEEDYMNKLNEDRINNLLEAIIIIYGHHGNGYSFISLVQNIYQYIGHITFRVMGIHETNTETIKMNRNKQIMDTMVGNGPAATLVDTPFSGPNLSFEPNESTIFNLPTTTYTNDNIQNVLDAISADTVTNDNIHTLDESEVYEALNMVGDNADKTKLEHLQVVNMTVHQIIRKTYTFFLQRENTNRYDILNSHYLKQLLTKYLLIVLYYQNNEKYDTINQFSVSFVNNIENMLTKICPLVHQSGAGNHGPIIGGGIDEDISSLSSIEGELLSPILEVKRNQLIKRLNKLRSTIKSLPNESSRIYQKIVDVNKGIEAQIITQVHNFMEDLNRRFKKKDESSHKKHKPSPEVKSVINLLCSEVAYNGLLQMKLIDTDNNVYYPEEGETIFNKQINILNGISNNENVSGIDNKLVDRILSKPGLWKNYRGTNNYKSTVPSKFTSDTLALNMPISVINNAITKISYRELLKSSVCSTPQYIDAMGGLGSCTVSNIGNTVNEFPSTVDINIVTETADYYNSFIKHDKNRVDLEFNYRVDNITSVPYYKKFHIKDGPKILSASNTMDALTTKIMYLWKKRYIEDTSQDSAGVFQDLYNQNFNELISIASEKGKGDRSQEENSVFINGAYKSYTNYNPANLRVGAMGDRPSGFRAMLDMNFLDPSSVRPNTIAGYFSPKTMYAVYSPNLHGGGNAYTKKNKRKKTNRKKTNRKKMGKKNTRRRNNK